MQRISKGNQKALCAGKQARSGMYYGAFRTSPHVPQASNHSWTAPLVAPVQPCPVTEPSEYKFASRAPVVRRSPPTSTKASATRNPRSKAAHAHHRHPSVPSGNGKQRASGQQDPYTIPSLDSANQYDEFLASFQHRIDYMTGQRGGWGF
ncbi:hypothetical protein BJV74DRAFT_806915 [Russula compacta]|nr:hypothetical protein BJV74DRAFT_806915 [Russula compacta]